MPPNSKVENEDEEQGLQAIVFADSFNARFKPLTDKKPRVSSSSLERASNNSLVSPTTC